MSLAAMGRICRTIEREENVSYADDYRGIDFRAEPQRYRVGVGEQGVLIAEPYKSEILPHWRFRTEELARESAEKIYALFRDYRDQDDFVGMDLARKYLQMGWTRSRRYANHRSGRKYRDGEELPREADALDNEKARAARHFYEKYARVLEDAHYERRRREWVERYG